ncbi:MAG: gluconate 2-dehydrogenase subunit 3 family protein, partial [Verrucomicrobia bacterium]|nr:gluconate 2-dehydrogenase subunit 3 family protein [Verrucomicrobiota bacterium]
MAAHPPAVEPRPRRESAKPTALPNTAARDWFARAASLGAVERFYSDPIYGGNKNRVGWKLIGFEGPESLAETHSGRYTTLPFFAKQQ